MTLPVRVSLAMNANPDGTVAFVRNSFSVPGAQSVWLMYRPLVASPFEVGLGPQTYRFELRMNSHPPHFVTVIYDPMDVGHYEVQRHVDSDDAVRAWTQGFVISAPSLTQRVFDRAVQTQSAEMLVGPHGRLSYYTFTARVAIERSRIGGFGARYPSGFDRAL